MPVLSHKAHVFDLGRCVNFVRVQCIYENKTERAYG